MNIYEIIKKELDEKSNTWNILDKLNYIYLRTLQLLSHDSRSKYSNNPNIVEELFEKEVNIFNLEDTRVVCSSWSKVYTDLVNCLLSCDNNFDISFTEGTPEPHMYSRVFLADGTTVDYDPLTKTNDFVRAKKQLPLKGIRINNHNDEWLNETELENSFIRIGYEINKKWYLKELKEVLSKENVKSKEILDILLKEIDYSDLDLLELNTFLNMQYKKHTGTSLESIGVKFKHTGENQVTITSNNENIYQEKEVKQKVIICKV